MSRSDSGRLTIATSFVSRPAFVSAGFHKDGLAAGSPHAPEKPIVAPTDTSIPQWGQPRDSPGLNLSHTAETPTAAIMSRIGLTESRWRIKVPTFPLNVARKAKVIEV